MASFEVFSKVSGYLVFPSCVYFSSLPCIESTNFMTLTAADFVPPCALSVPSWLNVSEHFEPTLTATRSGWNMEAQVTISYKRET